jgi:uncharacterized phage protein (TIGR01671 family)
MRQIKFRFWDSLEKDWMVDGRSETNIYDFAFRKGMNWPFLTKEEALKRIVVVQFSGLLDVNGKEIYEGDIVKNVYSEKVISVIKYGEFIPDFFAQFCKDYEIEPQPLLGYYAEVVNASWGVGQKLFLNKNIVVEIIGNRFENPELLEDKA